MNGLPSESGQQRDPLLVDDLALRRRCASRAAAISASDRDGLLEAADLHREVDAHPVVDADLDVVAQGLLEAAQLGRDGIDAGLQEEQVERPGLVRDRRGRLVGVLLGGA